METKSAYEKKLVEKFNEKGLSDKTIIAYMRNLQKLNDSKPIKSLTFLKDIDKIKQVIQKYQPTTKRNFYIAICSTTKAMNQPKIHKLYYDDLNESNKSIQEQESKGLKSERQEKNWIEWDDVLAAREEFQIQDIETSDLRNQLDELIAKYVSYPADINEIASIFL